MFDYSCYQISDSKGSWSSGSDYCQGIGGSYVDITSMDEFNYVKSLLSESTWIGLNDLDKEGTFVWQSGAATSFINFVKGEPNNGSWYSGSEDCVEMTKDNDYKWNDEGCGSTRRYACERSATVKRG